MNQASAVLSAQFRYELMLFMANEITKTMPSIYKLHND